MEFEDREAGEKPESGEWYQRRPHRASEYSHPLSLSGLLHRAGTPRVSRTMKMERLSS